MKSNTLVLNPVSSAIVVFVVLSLCHAHAATPVPKVTGPLPVTATSYPFGAADHTMVPQNLKSLGYIEEEFLISGTSNVYDWPGQASVRVANAPYTTRVLVRRPVSRSRFSGNVAVEMLNPIAGNEKPFDASRLKQVYRDQKTYERKVIDNVEKLVKERWITRADADELIAETKKARIPKR